MAGRLWYIGMDGNGHDSIKCLFCNWETSGWQIVDGGLILSDYDLLRFHVMTAHPFMWMMIQNWLNIECVSEEELERVQDYY